MQPVAIGILIILVTAKAGGWVFERLEHSPILGELAVGILIGPFVLGLIKPNHLYGIIAQLGIITLLFAVGLETPLDKLRRAGGTAAKVAVLGVFLTFVLGLVTMVLLGRSVAEALFVASILVATSVAVTASVLRYLRVLDRRASQIILAAAVIDDVLGLICLTIVRGAARSSFRPVGLALTTIEAILFVFVFTVVGDYAFSRLTPRIRGLNLKGAPVTLAFLVMLSLAALAERIGLAGIIGAFVAGVSLAKSKDDLGLHDKAERLSSWLAPFFFVLTGALVNPRLFLNPTIIGLTVLLSAIAIFGKLAASAIATKSEGRRTMLQIGLGMVPRGEVGLIIATIGLSANIVRPNTFVSVVGMIVITTLIAPPLIQWAFRGEIKAA